MENENQETLMNTVHTMAQTIGTQMLTRKMYELSGDTAMAETIRDQSVRLEAQLDKMLYLYHRVYGKQES